MNSRTADDDNSIGSGLFGGSSAQAATLGGSSNVGGGIRTSINTAGSSLGGYVERDSASQAQATTEQQLKLSFLKYRRSESELDWNYPFDFCGSIYRLASVREVIAKI